MNPSAQLIEEQRKEILAGLRLPLGPPEMPFALSESESHMGPDDWAWLFLRMNQDYQSAYAAHAQDADDPRILEYLLTSAEGSVKVDSVGTCRNRFGLAAWLNPCLNTLPKFKNNADSWFFPLKCPVSEDYRRNEVSDTLYQRSPLSHPRHSNELSYLHPIETPFGYVRPTNPTNLSEITWAVIDCSVPPEGQLSAFKALAYLNRKHLMDCGEKTRDKIPPVCTATLSSSLGQEIFGHMEFKTAKNAVLRNIDYTQFWQPICIETLAPIVAQTANILKRLKKIHQSLTNKQLTNPPLFFRFKNTLPAIKYGDNQSQVGGSYLKALLIIEELRLRGKNENQIAEILGISSASGRYLNKWRRDFHENIEKYMGESANLTDRGYQWLIHAQKPDSKAQE